MKVGRRGVALLFLTVTLAAGIARADKRETDEMVAVSARLQPFRRFQRNWGPASSGQPR
jgi:hypothetical protein